MTFLSRLERFPIWLTTLPRHGRARSGHPRLACGAKDVDGRHKAGHDGSGFVKLGISDMRVIVRRGCPGYAYSIGLVGWAKRSVPTTCVRFRRSSAWARRV